MARFRSWFARVPRFLMAGWLSLCLAPLGAQNLAFRRLDGRDGLPQSQVRVLLEDHQGFLWVGTHGGVARLGASGFKAYGLAEGLGIGRVRDLLEDGEGSIWVAQTDAGLARIRGSRVQSFGAAEGFPESNCYCLALEPSGAILVGHATGLHRWDGHAFAKVDLGGWSGEPVYSMAWTSEGLWLGSRHGKVALWKGGRLREEPLPPAAAQREVWRLRADPAGRPWALTRQGLFRHEAGGWAAVALEGFPGEPKLLDFDIDHQGDLLIGMGDAGVWLQRPDGTHQRLTSEDGLPEELINMAYRDRQGILWVGTNGEGLYAQVLPGLRELRGRPPLELGAVLDMEPLPGRGLFLGSSRGLFQWVEGRGVVARWTVKEGLPTNEIWSLCPDGQGGLWLGSARGLAHWRDGQVLPGKLLGDARVFQILRRGAAYLVGTETGLSELDSAGRLTRHFDLPREAGINDAYVLLEDDGGVLVGSSKGLYRFDGRALARAFPDAPFAGARVVSLYRDARGLWVGTIQGLYHQEQGAWSRIGIEDGLPDAHIYFVGDAGQGRIAIGHGKGVSILNPDGVLQHLNQNLGLLSDETNQGSVYLDEKGRLWFGMIDGVCILDTKVPLRLPEAPAPVVLETLWARDRAHLPTSLELPPRPDFAEFDFELGLPITSRPPLYEVRMEGLSDAWQRITEGHRERYGGLRAGDYQFRVRASLDGIHWKEGRAVALKVRPTWYEHPLGRAFLLLLAAGLVVAFIQWRTVQLRKAAQELEAKVDERTRSLDQRNQELQEAHAKVKELLESKVVFTRMVVHDLRSPLTTLTLLVEHLMLEARERGEEPAAQLGLMAQEAERLEGLLRRMLDQSRIEAVDQTLHLAPSHPPRLLAGLEEVLRLQAEGAGLAFRWEHAAYEGQILADSLAVQQVILNLFGNALKVTAPGGTVGVGSRTEGGAWVLEVWDTGRGMDPAQVDRLFRPFTQAEIGDAEHGWGLGLSIVKALVDAHSARIDVESQPGRGTRFRISFPQMGSDR
ncbi:MAG TPA: two-component regulator propeller domain-containing protein [Holophagaceae bacterium]|nr:two-component regulator propeller domain-containing protein [Holophagaceae bacterium]